MKKTCAVLAAVALGALAFGCGKGKPAEAPGAGPAAAPAASDTAAKPPEAKVADRSEVTTTGGSIVVKGSGSGTVGPVRFDLPYYVVKTTYASPGPYSTLTVTHKVKVGDSEMDMPIVTAMGGDENVRVFTSDKKDQPFREMTFDVKSEGTYTIEFQKPPALDTAKPAPQTFTGGKGYVVTPFVKTAGNYVMLRMKYTGAVDPSVVGGMPLASGTLYDAQSGEMRVRDQSVSDGHVEQKDGYPGSAPGTYFAVVYCRKDGGTWQATITESSADPGK